MENFTMKNPTKPTLEEFYDVRDSYIKSLRAKLNRNEKLTDEEKDNLFVAIDGGETTAVYIARDKRNIDFSDCLNRYLLYGENDGKIELIALGYAPDKDTVARHYSQFDSLSVIWVSEQWPFIYRKGWSSDEKVED